MILFILFIYVSHFWTTYLPERGTVGGVQYNHKIWNSI